MVRPFLLMLVCWFSCAEGSQAQVPLNGELTFRHRQGGTILLDSVMKMATIGAVEIINATTLMDGTMEVIVDFVKNRESNDPSASEGKRIPYFEVINSKGGLVSSYWIGEHFSKLLLIPAYVTNNIGRLRSQIYEIEGETAIIYLDSLASNTHPEFGSVRADQIFKGVDELNGLMPRGQCPMSITWDQDQIIKEITCFSTGITVDSTR